MSKSFSFTENIKTKRNSQRFSGKDNWLSLDSGGLLYVQFKQNDFIYGFIDKKSKDKCMKHFKIDEHKSKVSFTFNAHWFKIRNKKKIESNVNYDISVSFNDSIEFQKFVKKLMKLN
jgi:hypothetical protein